MYSPHRGCVRTLRTLYVYATLFIYSDAWIHDDNCNRFYCACSAMHSADYAAARCLTVRPSVHLSHQYSTETCHQTFFTVG